ncbi:MAG: glycerol-3-phosphate dehydrogenase C-terminal domain-containing protein, partial [Anaerolineales bacterium]|nr:glycerol-3-phosphate dehydrogenase C-terminal domain-containing protein [Anaerolineales bacterium]
PDIPVLDAIPPEAEAACAASKFSPTQCLRLLARYGPGSAELFAASGADLQPVDGTIYLWAELRQAARAEGVVHLDDLLLRRVRLGLLVPNGGLDQMSRIRSIVQPELGWDDARWQVEEKSYAELWNRAYRL